MLKDKITQKNTNIRLVCKNAQAHTCVNNVTYVTVTITFMNYT